MPLLGLFRPKFDTLSMSDAVERMKQDSSIQLLDVRSRQEYAQGHIPGSRNLPLDQIQNIAGLVPDKETKIFIYCLSGGRSQSACGALVKMGYHNAVNIGGISSWKGKRVTGMG